MVHPFAGFTPANLRELFNHSSTLRFRLNSRPGYYGLTGLGRVQGSAIQSQIHLLLFTVPGLVGHSKTPKSNCRICSIVYANVPAFERSYQFDNFANLVTAYDATN